MDNPFVSEMQRYQRRRDIATQMNSPSNQMMNPSFDGQQTRQAADQLGGQATDTSPTSSSLGAFSRIATAVMANHLYGAANQQYAQGQLLGPQNAYQLPGVLA